jgi:radical SAM superfamily enzyme YgiQ (UPF0313 family)
MLGDFESRPDLVAITIITGTAMRGDAIAEHFRRRGIPVVIGGVHASLAPVEVMQHAVGVATGFGEITWPQGVVYLGPADAVIASVKHARMEEVAPAAAAPVEGAVAAPAEPEVIARGKKEEAKEA